MSSHQGITASVCHQCFQLGSVAVCRMMQLSLTNGIKITHAVHKMRTRFLQHHNSKASIFSISCFLTVGIHIHGSYITTRILPPSMSGREISLSFQIDILLINKPPIDFVMQYFLITHYTSITIKSKYLYILNDNQILVEKAAFTHYTIDPICPELNLLYKLNIRKQLP